MPTYGKCFSCLWAIPYCMTFPFSEYCTACILKHSFQFAVFNSDPPFYLVCAIIIIRNFTYVNIVYVILRISIFCCWIQQAADSFASTNIEDFKSQRTIQLILAEILCSSIFSKNYDFKSLVSLFRNILHRICLAWFSSA
jgi:hypothetical protein